MKNGVEIKRKKPRVKTKIKRFLTEYFHCIAWAAAGASILAAGRISRLQYFITWAALMVVMWRCMPDKQRTEKRTGMAEVMEKYPIGAAVRLNSGMLHDETRTVQGYKQIGDTMYLIFSEGDSACVQRAVKG